MCKQIMYVSKISGARCQAAEQLRRSQNTESTHSQRYNHAIFSKAAIID